MRRTALAALLALPGVVLSVSAAPLSSDSAIKGPPAMFKRISPWLKKTKPAPDLIGLQSSVVRSIAADVTNLQDGEWGDRDWVFLAVNHEVLVEEGRRSSTQASVIAHRPGGELEDLDFRLSMVSKGHLLALRAAMTELDNRTWTILDLNVERSGRYNFAFSYEPPPVSTATCCTAR